MARGLAQMALQWTPDPARAGQIAESLMGSVLVREALTLAFSDTYVLMALLFAAALVIVPFAKPAPVDGPPASEH